MIKLYTTVIPDYGGVFFYIAEFCFSSRTHSTDYLNEATLKKKEQKKKKAISVSNRRSTSCMHYFRSSKNVKLVDKRGEKNHNRQQLHAATMVIMLAIPYSHPHTIKS